MAPEDQRNSSPIPSDASPLPAGDPAPSSAQPLTKSLWKWLFVVVGVALLAYPALRRSPAGGNAPAGNAAELTAHLDQSLQHYQAGRYPEAIASAKEALKLNPNSELAYNNIAASYGGMKMWDEAIANAREALRIRPDFQLAQNNLAWFLKSKQDAAAVPPTPESKAAMDHLNLSLVHYQAARFKECIAEAREALKLKPDYAEAYNNLAAAYIGLQDWDEAIKNAQEALRIDPGFALARNNLNLALRSKASAPATRK